MKAEMPLRAGGAIGDRHDDHHVADAAVRRERLRAVQHPARRRSRAAVVRMPAASLPEVDSVSPQAPIFSPRASGTRYRCFCASVPNRKMCAEQRPLCAATDSASAGIDARQLLDADAVVDRRHAGAAVLLRKLNAHQTRARPAPESISGGKMLRLVPLADVRANFGLRELADAAAQQFLLFGQPEVHRHETVPSSGLKASSFGLRASGSVTWQAPGFRLRASARASGLCHMRPQTAWPRLGAEPGVANRNRRFGSRKPDHSPKAEA